MSKISLKHSGGNVVSLNSPTNAPGAADVAFKLPNADGSANEFLKTDGSGNLSFGAAGGGKIVQFKSVSLYGDNSTNSNTFVALPNMPSLDITPTVATSLMFLTISSTIFNGSNNRGVQVTVYKKVGSGSYADLRTDGNNGGMIGFHGDAGDNNAMSPFCLTHEDDHNTTDALSYKIYLRTTNADSNAHLGRASGGNYTKTTFSVFEVATT